MNGEEDMEPNYEKLMNDLQEYGEDAALNLLHRLYADLELRDNREIKSRLEQLNNILEKLPLREYDEVFYLMVALCDEHEKRGFLGGVRIGAKLMQELR